MASWNVRNFFWTKEQVSINENTLWLARVVLRSPLWMICQVFLFWGQVYHQLCRTFSLKLAQSCTFLASGSFKSETTEFAVPHFLRGRSIKSIVSFSKWWSTFGARQMKYHQLPGSHTDNSHTSRPIFSTSGKCQMLDRSAISSWKNAKIVASKSVQ